MFLCPALTVRIEEAKGPCVRSRPHDDQGEKKRKKEREEEGVTKVNERICTYIFRSSIAKTTTVK